MEGSVTSQVIAVLRELATWFVEAFNSLLGIFYNPESGLTVIGTIAIISFAVSLVLVLVNWIRSLFM